MDTDEDMKRAAYKYMNNHQKEKYDRITILRPSGDKAALTAISQEKGYQTLTQFINDCINEKLKRMRLDISDYKSGPDNSD